MYIYILDSCGLMIVSENCLIINMVSYSHCRQRDRENTVLNSIKSLTNWGWPDLPQLCGNLVISMKFN